MAAAPARNQRMDEQLSAWLDDELSGAEVELLTTRLARTPEYQARLARYSLISSSLRGDPLVSGGGALAALQLGGRVRAALDEPAGLGGQPAAARRNRALPYALAAGLAVVVLAFALVQGPRLRPVAGPALASIQTAPPAGRTSLSPGRLTNYLVYHGEYSGLLSSRLTESHIVNYRPVAAALRKPDRLPAQ